MSLKLDVKLYFRVPSRGGYDSRLGGGALVGWHTQVEIYCIKWRADSERRVNSFSPFRPFAVVWGIRADKTNCKVISESKEF